MMIPTEMKHLPETTHIYLFTHYQKIYKYENLHKKYYHKASITQYLLHTSSAPKLSVGIAYNEESVSELACSSEISY